MIKRYIEFIKESFTYENIPNEKQMEDYFQALNDEIGNYPKTELYYKPSKNDDQWFANCINPLYLTDADKIVGYKYTYNNVKIDTEIQSIITNIAKTLTDDNSNINVEYFVDGLFNIGTELTISIYNSDYDVEDNIYKFDKNTGRFND